VIDPDAPILGRSCSLRCALADYNIGDVARSRHPEFALQKVWCMTRCETFVLRLCRADNNQNGIIKPGWARRAMFTNVG
jgi:hypothetical protein